MNDPTLQPELDLGDALQPNEIWVVSLYDIESYWVPNPKYDDSAMHGFGSPSRSIKGGMRTGGYWTSTRDAASLEHLKKRIAQIKKEKEFYKPEIEEKGNYYQPYRMEIEFTIEKKRYFLKNQ